MYIKTDIIENIPESLNKRENENSENSPEIIAGRFSSIIVILSWYIYGKYIILCLKGLMKHKNLNFLFPLTAALFAFINNSNDIFNYIYHSSNCYTFYVIFVASATLNWAPISWLQAYRLALIAKIYLSKTVAAIIIALAVILSCTYCTFYFLNLSLFDHSKSEIIGCGVTNPGTWTPYIMISDIADSVFSLASICVIIFKSINQLKEINARNDKLNNLVGQGVIELLIIAIAKIIIYPLIKLTSYIPGLDVFWDILSIIVIISAYNLVNFPYENLDDSKNENQNQKIRRSIFKFIDSSVNRNSVNISGDGSINSIKVIKPSESDSILSDIKRASYNPNYSFCNTSNSSNGNYNRNIRQL